jgi:4'-phosphopantetheinyl transferase
VRRFDVDIWPFAFDDGRGDGLVRSVLDGYAWGRELRFSVSRSGSFGLLAVTRGRDMGVDLERIEPRRALGPIADKLFDAGEAAELRSLPEGRRTRRFFELWTQKEAFAKALGVGLTVPLDRLRPSRGWSVVDLPLGPDHVGALCVRGRRPRVRLLG